MASSERRGRWVYFLGGMAVIILMLIIFLPQGQNGVQNQPGRTQASSVDNATQVRKSTKAPTETTLPTATINPNNAIKTVWIVMMENYNWSDIFKSSSAPFINQTLLPQSSYATQYFNPPNLHPSMPNYLWLEAGTNFGITSDGNPSDFHQSTTRHLVTLLNEAQISWKSYQEGISGSDCPLSNQGFYVARHNPMVYFDDVTNNNNAQSAYCIAHVRPYSEVKADLQNGNVARFNFITPNLCNSMHNDPGCKESDPIKVGDAWLSILIPMIMNSQAYKDGGAIFITWDESQNGDHPIGMIVLSPAAKGGGYASSIHYTHSSTLRTFEEIFGIQPLLEDAAKATDLRDLFQAFP